MIVDLSTRLGGAVLPSPVLVASGCAGTGRELAQFCDLARLGGFTTPSMMARPRAGRPTPRFVETPSGVLSATGLPGPGIEAFLERDLPWLAEQGARTVVSVAGNSVEEYAELARRLHDAPGITAIEVNVACPNVEDRGLMFAWSPAAASAAVRAVRANTPSGVPVLAKLSPDVADIVTIALACVDGGADGLSMINTVAGVAIDPVTMRPALSGVSGGLSGPAVRPLALRCVYQVHAALPRTPIVGMGGVATGRDALEFLLAGASAVAVGTTLFHDPSAAARIVRELEEALAERGVERVTDIVGVAHRPSPSPGHAGPLPRLVRPERPATARPSPEPVTAGGAEPARSAEPRQAGL